MRAFVLLAAASAVTACGGGGGGSGDAFVAATIDGQPWRVAGQGSKLTTAQGMTSLTVLGYTPLAGSKQADTSKPQLEIVFTDVVPATGTFDIAATAYLSVMYMPAATTIYGAYAGSVHITHIDADDVEGTFAFMARVAPSGTDDVTVTDGSFSVPLSSN